MIVDSSALIAIVLEEPGFEAFYDALAKSPDTAMPAANWLEAAMVIDRRGDPVATKRLGALILTLRIRIAPFTSEHAVEGRAAWQRFGKGSGHPAQLNFGDCIAYGRAKSTGEPLLCKGQDFPRTDIAPALAP